MGICWLRALIIESLLTHAVGFVRMTLTKPPFISAQDEGKWLHVCLIARATSQQSRNEGIYRVKVTSTN